MEPAKERISEEFYRFIVATPEISPFVEGQPERGNRHRLALAWWFSQLFRGQYDDRYFQDLQRIGATHVRIGLEILSPLNHLGEALLYIRDHHEHWDGGGYPFGRAADDITMVVVTHEVKFARQVAHRVVLMAEGEVVEVAEPEQFFTNPSQERSRRFLDQIL